MSLQIQLKKSAVSQKQPFASDLAVGELALNYNADGPFLTCKDTAGNVRKLNHVWVSATAPTSPSAGDLWLDTSATTAVLKVYKDSSATWVNATSIPLATTSVYGTVQLATSADITNGTSGKVVDAAQLQSKVTTGISSALAASPTTIQSLSVTNNAVVGGNLTVNGTTTTINTQDLLVEDKNIIIGNVDTPSDVTADSGGITLKGTTDKTINWVDATDSWTSSEHVDLASGKSYRINGTEVLSGTALGSAVQISSANIPNGTIVDADVNASAAIAGTKVSPDFGSQNVTTTGTSTAASFIPTSSTVPANGVYLPSANNVAISTNGTGRLFVDSNGRVGVGGAPGYPLDVHGASTILRVQSSNTNAYFRLDTTAASSALLGSQDSSLVFYPSSSSGEKMRITSDGKVGLGTSSPARLLSISDQDNASIRLTNTRLSAGTDQLFGAIEYEKSDASGAGAGVVGAVRVRSGNSIAGSAYMTFSTSSSSGNDVERVRIDPEGRVGVGTTSPAEMLTIGTSSAGGNLRLNSSSPGNNGLLLFYDTANAMRMQLAANTTQATVNALGVDLRFVTGGSESARLDTSGRLLVGTSTTPPLPNGQSIYVAGTGSSDSGIQCVRFNPSYGGYALNIGRSRGSTIGDFTSVSNNDDLGSINWHGADGTDMVPMAASINAEVDGTPGANDMPGRIVLSTTASGASSPTERCRIANNGVYTIYSSTSALFVGSAGAAGTSEVLINGYYGATGTTALGTLSFRVYTNGDVQNTNNTYGAISDIKLKENIVDASSQWDDIKALRPVNYNFKEGQTHTQLGLIAQEVELVSPGLVSESPDRDEEGNDLGTVTKSVNYSVLYMKAVKALQEAMERIETLEASNTDLLARVSALESA